MRCDSHIHVVGPHAGYPQVPNRTYLADVATLTEIEAAASPRDVRRFVIVQPSFYGSDNTLLLETVDALAGCGRGVAVIEPGALSAQELSDYSARGVCGLRINLYSPLGQPISLQARFAEMETLARDLNWHIEVIAALKLLAQESALLARSTVPVVIDHYGLVDGFTPESAEGRALLDFLKLPHVWIKLSAPYRSSADALATRPDPAWLSAFLQTAPERCVWGSDWPHTAPHEMQGDSNKLLPYRPLRYTDVFDDFADAVGSAELCERILVDNPARLYGFA